MYERNIGLLSLSLLSCVQAAAAGPDILGHHERHRPGTNPQLMKSAKPARKSKSDSLSTMLRRAKRRV